MQPTAQMQMSANQPYVESANDAKLKKGGQDDPDVIEAQPDQFAGQAM